MLKAIGCSVTLLSALMSACAAQPSSGTKPVGVDPAPVIDGTSPEAAQRLVQTYGHLLEQRRFGAARRLWGGDGAASGLTETQFMAAHDKYAAIHSQVGKPFEGEGAAGSIFIQVPLRLSGTLMSGGSFNLVGSLTLRRVNDVDGATPAQLRWHIVQSDLKPRP